MPRHDVDRDLVASGHVADPHITERIARAETDHGVARMQLLRWAVQSALQRYLHTYDQSLQALYRLLAAPPLDTFAVVPTKKDEWASTLSVRQLMLAELDSRWIKDLIVYWLTRWLRDRRVTPLTRFAGMLYDLLVQEKVIEDDEAPFDLGRYREVYEAVGEYPGGAALGRAFFWMDKFLGYRSLRDLVEAVNVSTGSEKAWAAPESVVIHPAVWNVLGRLGAVGREMTVYLSATSRANRQGALLRATDNLKQLAALITADVVAPEQAILHRIVRQWQALIIAEGGVVGHAALSGPVANPYILNNPAEGACFVGRDDIMRRLEELWSAADQVPSVVIYGHRRMGKTSILHNLGQRFGAQTVIVDFDMQVVGRVAHDADLLYQLAVNIYDECKEQGIVGLDEPTEQDFPAEQPNLSFTRFLKRLDSVRDGRRLIITIDEFEKIEALIEEGRLTPALLDFWRGTFLGKRRLTRRL